MMEFDLTQEKARHSVAEHHELDELDETLEETGLDQLLREIPLGVVVGP